MALQYLVSVSLASEDASGWLCTIPTISPLRLAAIYCFESITKLFSSSETLSQGTHSFLPLIATNTPQPSLGYHF